MKQIINIVLKPNTEPTLIQIDSTGIDDLMYFLTQDSFELDIDEIESVIDDLGGVILDVEYIDPFDYDEKDYTVVVKLEYVNAVKALSKEHAIEIVKEIFADEHRIKLSDNEITVEE